VAPVLYRLRLLNGCNSRTLNLSLFQMAADIQAAERPFFQIGGDQGFLPAVVLLQTGISLALPGDGTIPLLPAPAPDAMQALLMGPAVATRQLTLNEEESTQLCVQHLPDASITTLFNTPNDPNFVANCTAAGGVPMAPKAALLGVLGADPVSGLPVSVPKLWMNVISENPVLGDTEEWEIFNLTMDAHPIHLHLVRFQVINRQDFDPATFAPIPGTITPPDANEEGFKDTAFNFPGQITRIRAHFDRAGLYVWHCHILEHEDNEMMRPYLVRYDPAFPDLNGDNRVDRADLALLLAQIRSPQPVKLAFDLNLDQKVDLLDARILTGKLGLTR